MKELASILLTALTTSCWWAFAFIEIPKGFIELFILLLVSSTTLLCIKIGLLFINNWDD